MDAINATGFTPLTCTSREPTAKGPAVWGESLKCRDPDQAVRRDQLQAPFFSACDNTSVDPPPVHELAGSWSLVQVEFSPGLEWVPETEEGFLLDLDKDGTWKDAEGDSGTWGISGNHLELRSVNVGTALEGRYMLQAEESVMTLLVPVPVFNLFLEVFGEEPLSEDPEEPSEEIRFTFKRYSSSE